MRIEDLKMIFTGFLVIATFVGLIALLTFLGQTATVVFFATLVLAPICWVLGGLIRGIYFPVETFKFKKDEYKNITGRNCLGSEIHLRKLKNLRKKVKYQSRDVFYSDYIGDTYRWDDSSASYFEEIENFKKQEKFNVDLKKKLS